MQLLVNAVLRQEKRPAEKYARHRPEMTGKWTTDPIVETDPALRPVVDKLTALNDLQGTALEAALEALGPLEIEELERRENAQMNANIAMVDGLRFEAIDTLKEIHGGAEARPEWGWKSHVTAIREF